MNTSLISIHQRILVRYALQWHQVFAYPTESVFGLGCSPWDEHALKRLLQLKHRDWRKGLIVVAADLDQLAPLLQPMSPQMIDQLANTWPGPVTWLLPAKKTVSPLLCGLHSSLAVRVSAHPIVQELCSLYGPLVSTSANVAGRMPAKTALKARQYFGDDLAVVVSGSVSGLDKPTQIRDMLTGEYVRY